MCLIAAISLQAQETLKPKKEQKTEWDVPPTVLKSSPIKYPEDARKDKIEGKIFLKVIIDKDWKVKSAEIFKYDNVTESMLTESKKAVLQYVFSPAKLKGKPVKSEVTLPIKFKLQ